jgi:hypothetical protein
VQFLITLLQGSLRHLAVPTASLSRELQRNYASGAALRALHKAIDKRVVSVIEVCGTWAAENLFAASTCSTTVLDEIAVTLRTSHHSPQATPKHYKAYYQRAAKPESRGRCLDTVVFRRVPVSQPEPIRIQEFNPEEELPSLPFLL